jgi:hypothetical protein
MLFLSAIGFAGFGCSRFDGLARRPNPEKLIFEDVQSANEFCDLIVKGSFLVIIDGDSPPINLPCRYLGYDDTWHYGNMGLSALLVKRIARQHIAPEQIAEALRIQHTKYLADLEALPDGMSPQERSIAAYDEWIAQANLNREILDRVNEEFSRADSVYWSSRESPAVPDDRGEDMP